MQLSNILLKLMPDMDEYVEDRKNDQPPMSSSLSLGMECEMQKQREQLMKTTTYTCHNRLQLLIKPELDSFSVRQIQNIGEFLNAVRSWLTQAGNERKMRS